MKTVVMLTAIVAMAVSCGKSQAPPLQIEIDLGADVGLADASEHPVVETDTGEQPGDETPRPDLEVVLMDYEVTFEEGRSPRLEFEVPDDAISVTVSVTGQKGHHFGLAEWVNGDGNDLVPSTWIDSDQGAPSLCLTCPNRILSSESSFAAIVPNNERVAVAEGTHAITAYGFSMTGLITKPLNSGSATVRVIVKRRATRPTSGVLDVNFYLTGAQGWTEETAPTDETLQQVIADVAELYEQVGIELGTITYTDIGEEYAVVEAVLFGPDLQELFELSAGQPRNAINVFLVEELFLSTGPGFGVLLGVSGGIPGPPFAGTPRSGVVISTKGDPQFDLPTANVIAHEIGHHLGLFHTTESQGPIHDPIDDTPPDDTTQLMYHASDGTVLTAAQGAVMRANVWVHHQESE